MVTAVARRHAARAPSVPRAAVGSHPVPESPVAGRPKLRTVRVSCRQYRTFDLVYRVRWVSKCGTSAHGRAHCTSRGAVPSGRVRAQCGRAPPGAGACNWAPAAAALARSHAETGGLVAGHRGRGGVRMGGRGEPAREPIGAAVRPQGTAGVGARQMAATAVRAPAPRVGPKARAPLHGSVRQGRQRGRGKPGSVRGLKSAQKGHVKHAGAGGKARNGKCEMNRVCQALRGRLAARSPPALRSAGGGSRGCARGAGPSRPGGGRCGRCCGAPTSTDRSASPVAHTNPGPAGTCRSHRRCCSGGRDPAGTC